MVTPAATDTWVHDAQSQPLLVVTSEMNAKLTQVLEPILADVRRLVGDQRRMTVIFDRGGFSPKLFARLIASGFDVITYRKGKVKKLADRLAPSQHGIGVPQLANDLLRAMSLLRHRESPCPSWAVRTLIPHGSVLG